MAIPIADPGRLNTKAGIRQAMLPTVGIAVTKDRAVVTTTWKPFWASASCRTETDPLGLR